MLPTQPDPLSNDQQFTTLLQLVKNACDEAGRYLSYAEHVLRDEAAYFEAEEEFRRLHNLVELLKWYFNHAHAPDLW